MPGLFKKADAVLNDQLDGLLVSFKTTNPDFWNAYQSARLVVENPSGRKTDATDTKTDTKAA